MFGICWNHPATKSSDLAYWRPQPLIEVWMFHLRFCQIDHCPPQSMAFFCGLGACSPGRSTAFPMAWETETPSLALIEWQPPKYPKTGFAIWVTDWRSARPPRNERPLLEGTGFLWIAYVSPMVNKLSTRFHDLIPECIVDCMTPTGLGAQLMDSIRVFLRQVLSVDCFFCMVDGKVA